VIKKEQMGGLGMKLHTDENQSFTCISNQFIDVYLPRANGDYVKVYLYLLRCLQSNIAELSTHSISDFLELTEGDIIRALRYWEKEGILALAYNGKQEISDLVLLPLSPASDTQQVISQTQVKGLSDTGYSTSNTNSYIPATGKQNTVSPKLTAGNAVSHISAASASATLPDYQSITAAMKTPDKASDMKNQPKDTSDTFRRKDYSAEELNSLKSDVSYDSTLKVIESYLGHPLNVKDIQTATFIFDELHFSADLIFHLYEYCINRGKCRPEYIEQVAISWAKSGVTTPDDAEQASMAYNADYSAVCRAFGMQRMPGKAERKYIDHWVRDLALDTAIIEAACNRTILKISKPDFKYTNTILESWHKENVHTLADIDALDEKFKTRQMVTPKKTAKTPTNNRFNQFPQRNYSKEDFADMEKRLLAQTRMS
jgi:DnaD/phage-associated family protein